MITIIKFGADWCAPCRALETALKDKEYEKVDVGVDKERALSLGIRSLPTTIFYKDGVESKRILGVFSAEKFDNIIKELEDGE